MSRYFPLFVNLEGKDVRVYGAGAIAGRRIRSLADFGCALTVIAPEASEAVLELAGEGSGSCVRLERRVYVPGEIPADTCLVLAATGDREVNRDIWKECKEKGIPVNVSSEKELCDFYFPGLAVQDELVAGVTAGGSDHRLAREAAEQIRAVLASVKRRQE